MRVTAHSNDETAVMAYTQCMRDQGIEPLHPVVDADGSVQKPETTEELAARKEGVPPTRPARQLVAAPLSVRQPSCIPSGHHPGLLPVLRHLAQSEAVIAPVGAFG